MKLRFHKNSLRLRLNRQEVAALANGQTLEERVQFPGNAALAYRLVPGPDPEGRAELSGSTVTVYLPFKTASAFQGSDDLGIYYHLQPLEVAIEKDLECTELADEEQDPYAYPRKAAC